MLKHLVTSRSSAKAAGAKHYFTGIECKRGHLDRRLVSDFSCLSCNREKAAQQRAENPDIVRRRVRESYQRNIDSNRQAARDRAKAKRLLDPEAARQKARTRMANDPLFAFKRRTRQLIRSSLNRNGFRKAAKTESMLGCTLAQFKRHIEKQFHPGMSWENSNLWEIDHIVPMSTAGNQEEADLLNRFTNLRPLWRLENRSKHEKQTHLL